MKVDIDRRYKRDLDKVRKCVESCETVEQLMSCVTLSDILIDTYREYFEYNKLRQDDNITYELTVRKLDKILNEKEKKESITDNTENKPKFIKDAIVYCKAYGSKGKWMRASDMNLTTYNGEERYVSPYGPNVFYGTVYPYEDWMEKYIGTDNKGLVDEIDKRKNIR